jgi:excisionase family DNA binding protein
MLWWGYAMKASKPTPIPHLLSIATVAVWLGVSGKTVRRMIRDRQLPSHRIGRQIRISQADLVAFLVRSRSV